MTPQERIKADADTYAGTQVWVNKSPEQTPEHLFHEYISANSYIAGATAEHEKIEAAIDSAIHKERNALQAKVTQLDMDWLKRAQVLVDALSDIASGKVLPQFIASMALEQWKSGKGKEVGDG